MAIDLVVPSIGESITEVQIGTWHKKVGDHVKLDEPVVEVESDKATVEVFAPAAGVIKEIALESGTAANVGDIVGKMEEQEDGAGGEEAADEASEKKSKSKPAREPDPSRAEQAQHDSDEHGKRARKAGAEVAVMPAAKRLLAEHGLKASEVEPSGDSSRLLKEDVQRHLNKSAETPAAPAAPSTNGGAREEDLVPMSPMRKRIASTLVSAQQQAALLTTFNEVDMTEVMSLRKQYKEDYLEKYGIKLGFMSFFVKACVEALKEFPQVNAEVRGTDIAYRNYYDVGIAVGGGKGLVVPVLRNAERMSFADIELGINDFGKRAAKNKIALEELRGGTFTISNGGIYGSLLSTPIVNPPQSGILGMHKIEERPVARNGEVVIRPMMYLALSYDHRIVDGREAVTFLVRVKECIENPSRILLEV